jgi:predicted GNAT family acetyltransferase
MAEQFTIEREQDKGGGRYVIRLGGDEAEMTYSNAGDKRIAIGHTYVPPSMRGKGLAEALVKRGIADARAEGTRILPYCSYVRLEFQRHPEWHDLLAD